MNSLFSVGKYFHRNWWLFPKFYSPLHCTPLHPINHSHLTPHSRSGVRQSPGMFIWVCRAVERGAAVRGETGEGWSLCPQLYSDQRSLTMPAFLHWKYWTKKQRKHKAKKVTKDYVYLQWEFSPQQERREETYKTYDVVDNIDRTVYSDIQTWLASQPHNTNTEIYCDCCQADTSSNFTSLSGGSRLSRRQDSVSSVSTSHCSCSECLQYSDISDDESLYSSQLRRKSRDIFMAV